MFPIKKLAWYSIADKSSNNSLLLKTTIFLGVNINDEYFACNGTLLFLAVAMNDVEATKILLNHNALVNKTFLPNHMTPLIAASKVGYYDIAKLLLKHDAKPNIIMKDGHTALTFATSKGYYNIVKLLLEHNADPNIARADGNTALTIATDENYLRTAEILIKYGANVNMLFAAKDGHKQSLLDLVIKAKKLKNKSQIVALLKKYGAKSAIEIQNDTEKNRSKKKSQKIETDSSCCA
jgi:ankyrin repeat protein